MQPAISFDKPAVSPPAAGLVLLSFDVQADFGFLRKPDVNDGLSQSYNLLHRPALLGLLGAVAGLGGYAGRGQRPEYWDKLGHLRVGVAPLAYLHKPGRTPATPDAWMVYGTGAAASSLGERPRHERGSFAKTVVEYTNSVGYANADGTWILRESTLIRPAYRCFVLLDPANPVEALLAQRLRQHEAEFLPYLGKNEFAVSWNNVQEITDVRPFAGERDFQVVSAFSKAPGQRVKDALATDDFDLFAQLTDGDFFYFENLPIGFNEYLMQYRYAHFAFTNAKLNAATTIADLYWISETETVQLLAAPTQA